MPFKIYVSHSVSPRELGIVYAIAKELVKKGGYSIIPDRRWDPERPLPDRILVHFQKEAADYLLAIATSVKHLNWLNREIKEAAKKGIKILVIAEQGIKVPKRIPRVYIKRGNPAKTVGEVASHIAAIQRNKELKEALTFLGVGGLLLLLLGGKSK